MSKFNDHQINDALKQLDGWSCHNDREALAKKFQFKDFNEAFGWMNRIALYSERHDHHPEWFNVWNRVEVTLATHDAGGITQKDVDLAAFMNSAMRAM